MKYSLAHADRILLTKHDSVAISVVCNVTWWQALQRLLGYRAAVNEPVYINVIDIYLSSGGYPAVILEFEDSLHGPERTSTMAVGTRQPQAVQG